MSSIKHWKYLINVWCETIWLIGFRCCFIHFISFIIQLLCAMWLIIERTQENERMLKVMLTYDAFHWQTGKWTIDWLWAIDRVCTALDDIMWKYTLSASRRDSHATEQITHEISYTCRITDISVKCSQTSKWFDSSLLSFFL